jgi:hypothetical protein
MPAQRHGVPASHFRRALQWQDAANLLCTPPPRPRLREELARGRGTLRAELILPRGCGSPAGQLACRSLAGQGGLAMPGPALVHVAAESSDGPVSCMIHVTSDGDLE